MIKIFRNSVIAYVLTSIVGLPFCSNLALADAFEASSGGGIDLGKMIEMGVPTNFDPLSGLISTGGMSVMSLAQPKDGMKDQKSAYGNKAALGSLVSNTANRLDGEKSDAGEAYRTLMGGAKQPRPNLKNDIMVKNGVSVIDKAMNDPANTGCHTTIQSSLVDAGTIPLDEFKTCDRLTKTQPTCKIWREINMVRPLQFISGDGSGRDISLSQFEMTLGVDGDDYLNSKGRCGYYKTNIKIQVNNPDKILSAKLNYARYDDRIRVSIGNNAVFVGPELTGAAGVFDPKATSCELGVSWRSYPQTELAGYFNTVKPGDIVDVTVEVLYQGAGEGYAKMLVTYPSPEQIIHQDPPHCLDEIKADPDYLGDGHPSWKPSASINDQASNSYWSCTDASNAKMINLKDGGTYTVTTNDYDFLGPLFPDEPQAPPAPICFAAELRKLDVTTVCQDQSGDPNKCSTVDWSKVTGVDDCDPLRTDPDCSFVESVCQTYNGGVCTHYKDSYNCGTVYQNKNIVNTETLVCPGNISCMGETCGVARPSEQNARFNDAAVAMEVVKNANMNGECDQGTGGDCRIFKGEVLGCKKILGGMQDCCQMDLPPGPTLTDYMKLTQSTWELAKDTQVGKDLAQLGNGAWNEFSSAASDVASSITKPLMSAWDSFVGTAASGVDAVATGAEAAASVTNTAATQLGAKTITNKLTHYVAEWAADIFGDAIYGSTTSLFTENVAGEVILNVAGNMVAAFLSVVMWIYLIYQIITILVNIIWPCTDDEFSLASKKDLRVCHFMGTEKKKALGMTVAENQRYCCFASPFARIIHEQTRDNPKQPDLHKPWGDFKNPDCSGFTLTEFSTIDFGEVDLSEWIALLKLAEMTPTDPAVMQAEMAGDHAGAKKLSDDKFSASTMERARALIDSATGGSNDALDKRRQEMGNTAINTEKQKLY